MLIDGLDFTAPDSSLEDIFKSNNFQKAIHKTDNMTVSATDDIYYWMGKTGLDSIHAILNTINENEPITVKKILDFPSGYGRVMRFIRYAFPSTEITACDIDKIAVNFCSEKFGAIPIYSTENINELEINTKYDLIWVGSLFTHLTEDSANELFVLLHSLLAPGGILIFTIAGEFVFNLATDGEHRGLPEETIPTIQADFKKSGFAFGAYKQGIVEESNYGRTFISKSWLDNKIKDFSDLVELAYIHRGYARRQDVIGWRKGY